MVDSVVDKVENTTSDTSGKDITKEVEVDKSEVKIYSIEELVPSSTPITVPYFEVYRTNELEYIPYMSPYNVGCSASSSDSSSDSESDSESSEENQNLEGGESPQESSDSSNSSS